MLAFMWMCLATFEVYEIGLSTTDLFLMQKQQRYRIILYKQLIGKQTNESESVDKLTTYFIN